MNSRMFEELDPYPIPDPYAPAAKCRRFKRGDFVVHRWDLPKASEVMEVLDVRDDEICVRFLDGTLIAREPFAWMPTELFDYAPKDWATSVFVGAV